MIEKIENEKIEYRNLCRATHLMQCNNEDSKSCSNPLAHSPKEYNLISKDELIRFDQLPEVVFKIHHIDFKENDYSLIQVNLIATQLKDITVEMNRLNLRRSYWG